jgi:hypothetical protein
MNRQVNVDRELEGWLAEGPSQLPDHVIDSIVRQLEETHQRKHWWLPGREEMNRMILAIGGVAAAFALTILAVGMYLGLSANAPPVGDEPAYPAASPASITPAPTAGPTAPHGVPYTSERHGYSLLLPDETWTVEEFQGTWRLGSTFNEIGPGVDSVKEAGVTGRYILFNSQPVPSGESLMHWVIAYDEAVRRRFPNCGIDQVESVRVGEEFARVNTYVCGADSPAYEAVMLHGGRAYAIRVFHETDPKMDPRPIFDEWLSRFRFND